MKTILSGVFQQETNRYAQGVTTEEIFRCREAHVGNEAIQSFYRGVKCEMGGFMDFFADKADYCLAAPVAFGASPGPVVAQDIWQLVTDSLLREISKHERVDGILLALHGAMVTEEMEDAEGELLERLRGVVGVQVPIMVTLDLHANMTRKMMENADAFFAYDYYPHTDAYETGLRAAACMYETLEGRMRPKMAWKKLDYILPYMPTLEPVFEPFLRKAQSLRDSGAVVNVSICHGFFASDIYEQGVAVVAVTDDDPALAQHTADALGDEIFAARKELNRTYFNPQQAVKIAVESDEYPVVLADVNDNPGSGASTDATQLLKTLIEMDAKDVAVAVMYDPETVEAAEKAGIGATIAVRLGGKTAPEITGGPICCNAYVKALTDGRFRQRGPMRTGKTVNFGKCALLQIGGIGVIVSSCRAQPYDLEIFRHIGIQPQDMKILMVKSAAHFRADYGTIAAKILDVETPAQAPQRPEQLPLRHSRRPVYPLDAM